MQFSGFEWIIKTSKRRARPGGNCHEDNVWLDRDGLHLRIACRNGKWTAASVQTKETLGYGRYIFYVSTRYDELDKNVIVGLFTYENDRREIDIELSRWGRSDKEAPNTSFTVQSAKKRNLPRAEKEKEDKGNEKFLAELNGSYTTHRFKWQKGRVDFQSIHGHYPYAPKHHLIKEKAITENVHASRAEKTHINFWMYKGMPPADESEVIIKRFEFIPL